MVEPNLFEHSILRNIYGKYLVWFVMVRSLFTFSLQLQYVSVLLFHSGFASYVAKGIERLKRAVNHEITFISYEFRSIPMDHCEIPDVF